MKGFRFKKTHLIFLGVLSLAALAAVLFFLLRTPKVTEVTINSFNPSRIKVIDDFTKSQEQNKVGGKWAVVKPKSGEFGFTVNKDDALNDRRGSSLWVAYQLPAREKGVLETDLNNLDISQAGALHFWLKGIERSKKRIFVELEDAEGSKNRVGIVEYFSEKTKQDWQEILIPIEIFEDVDTENLKTFRLIFKGKKKKGVEGSFFFDHLIFVGPEELVFSSLSDNLMGFPAKERPETIQESTLLKLSEEKMLLELARLTWGYFENLVNKRTSLVVDHIQIGEYPAIGDYTSPTNIGLYFLAAISAHELGFISRDEAIKRIEDTFKTLKELKTWKGFFYNFYNTTNLQVTRPYVSVVDSGWLAAALIVVKSAFPEELGSDAAKFLEDMDFEIFYSKSVGQLRLGYDDYKKEMSPFHYGLLVTEARVSSFIAIAKGDVPTEHWYKLYRTPPPEWEWQTQKPLGRERDVNGNWVFGGLYRYNDYYIVPSWGGSMFEFLMPTLVMKEKELSPQALGRNNYLATKIHIDYALKKKKYPVWGLSPCSYPGGYGEFGVKEIGAKGYGDFGVITPHASFIALNYQKKAVLKNIKKFMKKYSALGEYGFFDSVKVRGKGKVTPKYLALDQGMILVSLANHLKNGIIRDYFHADEDIKKIEFLLKDEKFF